jgi:hypothetical protein
VTVLRISVACHWLIFCICCHIRCLGIDTISVYQWICHNTLLLLCTLRIVPGCVSVRSHRHHVAWLHPHSTHLDPEDGGSILLRNIGIRVSRLRVFHGNIFLYFTLSKPTPRNRCRDSPVGIVTGWTAAVRFRPETRDYSLLYSSGTHPASCTIDVTIPPLRHTSSWPSALLIRHRDIFAFYST